MAGGDRGLAGAGARYPKPLAIFLKTGTRAPAWVQTNQAEAATILVGENTIEPAVAGLIRNRRADLSSAPHEEFVADVTGQGTRFARLEGGRSAREMR